MSEYPMGGSPADTVNDPSDNGYRTGSQSCRFGPNPAKRFYQLDEQLLWCPDLTMIQRLLLMDLFHHERKGDLVPSIHARAKIFGCSDDYIRRAEQAMEASGYIIRHERPGFTSLYVAAFPAIPSGHPNRADFEAFKPAAPLAHSNHPPCSQQPPPPAHSKGSHAREPYSDPPKVPIGEQEREEDGARVEPAVVEMPGDKHRHAEKWISDRNPLALFGPVGSYEPAIDVIACSFEDDEEVSDERLAFAMEDARQFGHVKSPRPVAPGSFATGWRKWLGRDDPPRRKPPGPPRGETPGEWEQRMIRETAERRKAREAK